MAIAWGPVSNNFRLGIEVFQNPPRVGAGTGSVSLHVKVWGQSVGWGHNWTYTLSFGGAWSGSKSVSFYSATGATVTKLFHETWVNVSPSYGTEVAKTFTASLNGYGASSVSYTHRVGRRPYSRPRPPRNPTARYVADGRAQVSWQTNYDGASGAQPWDGVRILRKTSVESQWTAISSVHWSATSFEDTAAPAGASVQYAVVAFNSAGDSDQALAGTVNQRPSAPRNVSAAKRGSDIVVAWAADYPSGYITSFKVFDKNTHVGSAAGSASSWVHTGASPTQTHQYTVIAVTSSPTLESARSTPSNVVQLLARPLAPELVSPSGAFVAPGNVSLVWRHAPVDSSEQTKAEIRYRLKGGSWTTRTVTGAAQQLSVSLGVGQIEWQVRTWGAYQASLASGASPWSGVSAFTVVDAPVAQISSPGPTVATSSLSVSWSFYQKQGSAQSATQIRLYKDGGLVQETTAHGAATSRRLDVVLDDGAQYKVDVRVRSGHGLWSAWVSRVFDVAFPSPPEPVCVPQWDDERGCVNLNVTNPPPISTSAVRRNYVRNAEFSASNPLAHWTNWGANVEVVDGKAHFTSRGSQSYSILNYIDRSFELREGRWVSMSASYEAEHAKARLMLFWGKAGGGYLSSTVMTEPVTPGRLELVAQIPAGATSVQPVFNAFSEPSIVPALSDSAWRLGGAVRRVSDGVTVGAGDGNSRRVIQPERTFLRLSERAGHRLTVHIEAYKAANTSAGALDIGTYIYNSDKRWHRSLWAAENGNSDSLAVNPTGNKIAFKKTFVIPDPTDEEVFLGALIRASEGVTVTSFTVVDDTLSLVKLSEAIVQIGDRREDVEDTTFFHGGKPNTMINGQSYALSWTGAAHNSVTVATPNSVQAITNDIYRSVDGGQTWEQVAAGSPTNAVIPDYEALSSGTTLYRVVATSSLPSSSTLTVQAVTDSHSMWIGTGESFSRQVHLLYNPKVSFQTSLVTRKVLHFAGRRLGVEVTGTARQLTGTINSLIIEGDPSAKCSSTQQVQEIAYAPGPFVYRDHSGRRIYCSLMEVQISRTHLQRWQFSAKIEEISRE